MLNFPKGDNRANALTIPLGGGKLWVTFVGSSGATADVVFDVTGYYVASPSGGSYVALTPSRLVDSRAGTRIGLGKSLDNRTPAEIHRRQSVDRPEPQGSVRRHCGHRQPDRHEPELQGLPRPDARRPGRHADHFHAQLPQGRQPGQRAHRSARLCRDAVGHLRRNDRRPLGRRFRRNGLLRTLTAAANRAAELDPHPCAVRAHDPAARTTPPGPVHESFTPRAHAVVRGWPGAPGRP